VLIKPGWVNTPMTAHLKKNLLFASAEQVGRGVHDAMSSRKPRAVVYLPWYWNWIMKIIRVVPEPIFAKLNM
jgi:decaprenylphospho-beta-D-erythro-pentofuranosid-2-ulose 2-reductase